VAARGLASPLSIAAGLEYRDENYQQLLGDSASYTADPMPPRRSTAARVRRAHRSWIQQPGKQLVTRHSWAPTATPDRTGIDASQISYGGYLDLEADVLRWLTLGVADVTKTTVPSAHTLARCRLVSRRPTGWR